MQRAFLTHLLAFAVAAGNLASVTAVYDCAMSGQRSLKACCCSASGECPDVAAESMNAAGPASPGGAAPHEVRNACCKLSFEENAPTGPFVRGGDSGAAWKERLDHVRSVASLVASVPVELLELDSRILKPLPHERTPLLDRGPPLFIAHCALLI